MNDGMKRRDVANQVKAVPDDQDESQEMENMRSLSCVQ
jgi:hypothetical protein